MRIRDTMSAPPVSIPPEVSLEAAARRMADAGVGALPVVDDDRVVGMVTDRDLALRGMGAGLSPEEWVAAVMSTDPVTVEAELTVPEALQAMRSINTRHLPVTQDGRLVGVVSFDDLFCYLVVQLAELARVVNAARHYPEPTGAQGAEPGRRTEPTV